MKQILLICAAAALVGCADATEEPVMDLSIKEEVGGTYELKSSTRHSGKMVRFVFADDGTVEEYANNQKNSEYHLAGLRPEISITHTANQSILFFRKNPDGSLTHVANRDKNKTRIDLPKDKQETYKKTKFRHR
jgi:hypothetical protein